MLYFTYQLISEVENMYLAIKEIKHSKGKYLSIILVIALISWLIFLSSSLTEGLANGNRQEVDRWQAESIYLNEAANNTLSASFIEYKESTNKNEARVSTKFTTVRAKDTESESIVLLGYDKDSFIEPVIVEGSINSNDNEIVLAEQLKSKGFKVGDTIEINGEDELIISGFSEESSLNLSPVTYLRNTQFQDIVYSSQNNIVSAVLSKDDNYDLTIKDFIKEIPGYTAQNLTLNTLIYFLFAISTAIVGIFMYIITIQKTSLFGVLKAQGVQNKYLGTSVVWQSLILSILGLIIGLTLTFLITALLPSGIPYKISLGKIAIYSIILLLVSLLGSVFSVISVVKIDATKAIA